MTSLLNRFMALFLKDYHEKVDLETKIKFIPLNLGSIFILFMVLAESVWALYLNNYITASIYLSVLLVISILLVGKPLILKKLSLLFYQKILLIIFFIVCVLFVVIKSKTGAGIFAVIFLPFWSLTLKGRKEGTWWNLWFFLILVMSFVSLINIEYFEQQYTNSEIVLYSVIYAMAFIIAYSYEFLRAEIMLAKERVILESQNQNKAQEEIITKLSHQVRTPLSNVTGMIGMLEATSLTPEQKEYVSTIHTSTNNLVNVVNNLVMTTKSTVFEFQESTSFNLYKTVNDVLELFPYEQSKTRFSLSLAADIPTQLTGNSLKLKQILLNLINNISKHNDSEFKRINIEVVKKESMPDKVELSFKLVSDLIYNTKQEAHLSDSFFNYQELVKLNASKIINQFDLTITQKMIEVEGHVLSIIPQSDKTIFEFGATYKTSHSKLSSATPTHSEKKAAPVLQPIIPKEKIDMKNANILLVEDNFSNQQIISLYIKNEVNKIDIAFNGKEALEKFGLAKYDLILMDVQMPIMDGFKATQKIRELEQSTNSHIPIIAVTANAFPEDKERCFASGMDDYISKPFQPDELIVKIRENLSA